MKHLWSVPEVAERFDVTTQTVRNWIAAGRLEAQQPIHRGRYRIAPASVQAFELEATARSRGEGPPNPGPLAALPDDTEPQRMTSRPEAGEELRRVVDAVVAVTHPDAVVLFGSRARGDFDPSSDFDLALIVPDGTVRRQLAMRAYEGLAQVQGRSIGVDFVVLTPAMIAAERDVAGSIARAVIREGVSLYGATALA